MYPQALKRRLNQKNIMRSREIRKKFLEFFASKAHKIVPSAPLVNKNDPTLMFTNAGMNQFKDYFLGNKIPDVRRVADTQKCLRVSGKHNDLEDVGFDGTHHTMFEMLGNWSFGDYFKKEAIEWSWEFLTKICHIPANRLYATVFEGDEKEGLSKDNESLELWLQHLPEDQIVYGNKKDNFWEMGDTGPCGPCTEIHVDLRSDEERQKIKGETLVNMDHPLVVEIWNNVFIQYNRKANGTLEPLPERHVDTGMGFERLCMVLQNKDKSYDTDVFMPMIEYVESRTGIKYNGSYERSAKSDVAMRVIVDHIRAVAFTIADGELPGNSGAGYVVRRILRRAVRYYYSFLNIKEPFLYALVHILADDFDDVFPELNAQRDFVSKVVLEEEKSFLKTLQGGLNRLDTLELTDGKIDGQTAFELYDTYGFPIDLTMLIASEKGWTIDEAGFQKALNEQKARSRADAQKEVGDWVELLTNTECEFVGYDNLVVDHARIIKYRSSVSKGIEVCHIVLDKTPFYGESGGQMGDKGFLLSGTESIPVIDTKKENDLIILITESLPTNIELPLVASVNEKMRKATSSNHSAVHLMHAALHKIIGKHALQKGQDVNDQKLRFDFSHFQKLSDDELKSIEAMVNEKIRENILLEETRNMPIEEAKQLGAMMLFGEKYGEFVRVITFDPAFSTELCGGTHVPQTGQIALFKIVSESAVAAGVRRIEAVTGQNAQQMVNEQIELLDELKSMLKNPASPVKAVQDLQEDNKKLQKQIEALQAKLASFIKIELKSDFKKKDDVNYLVCKVEIEDPKAVKDLAYQLEKEIGNTVIVLGSVQNEKPLITIIVSENLTAKFHAGQMVKTLSSYIKGGGGGQAFFATAGGNDASGLNKALKEAEVLIG